MDPFEPSGYIPIHYDERAYPLNRTTFLTMGIFLMIYMLYLTCMLNCLRSTRY